MVPSLMKFLKSEVALDEDTGAQLTCVLDDLLGIALSTSSGEATPRWVIRLVNAWTPHGTMKSLHSDGKAVLSKNHAPHQGRRRG